LEKNARSRELQPKKVQSLIETYEKKSEEFGATQGDRNPTTQTVGFEKTRNAPFGKLPIDVYREDMSEEKIELKPIATPQVS